MSQSSFEIKSPKDLYLKLVREHKRILEDLWSSDHAINFSITAHHLYDDWLEKELTTADYNKLTHKINTTLRVEMEIIRDICDGSKHLVINKPPHLQVNDSAISKGSFSKEFSRAFDIGGLTLTLHDGTRMYFDNVADKVIDFWGFYFDPAYIPNHHE
jgi:hypothetical protein